MSARYRGLKPCFNRSYCDGYVLREECSVFDDATNACMVRERVCGARQRGIPFLSDEHALVRTKIMAALRTESDHAAGGDFIMLNGRSTSVLPLQFGGAERLVVRLRRASRRSARQHANEFYWYLLLLAAAPATPV